MKRIIFLTGLFLLIFSLALSMRYKLGIPLKEMIFPLLFASFLGFFCGFLRKNLIVARTKVIAIAVVGITLILGISGNFLILVSFFREILGI